MRFMPTYYTITQEEYSQECRMLNKEVDILKLEEINRAAEGCRQYEKAVSDAAKKAHKEFIEPHLHKNIIYSKTWGE